MSAKMAAKHYSALGRVTLCGKDVPFTLVPFTNTIELVTCKKCLAKYKARARLGVLAAASRTEGSS